MNQRDHWEKVYSTTPPDRVGWYDAHLQTSLKWIEKLHLEKDSNIIDIGGGASTLVDDLLVNGYSSITVVDISGAALRLAQKRIGAGAKSVTWVEGDITTDILPSSSYDLWHDRAVFHFLTTPEQRQQYLNNLLKALRPDGHLIMATFAPEAPPKCSGLPVERYSADSLKSVLGVEFVLEEHVKELHVTPGGVEQMYLYCRFHRIPQ